VGSSSVADRLWQLLAAVLPARRRILVTIAALNQVCPMAFDGCIVLVVLI
jgi:hypothetical protein